MSELPANLKSLFAQSLECRSLSERADYLNHACGDDAALRAEIEALLQAHDQASGFLERPLIDARLAAALPNGDVSPESALELLGASAESGSLGRLGQYEIREVVGRGGMGVVFKGHDAKLNRVVAVKTLSPELASSALARKRVLREAQAVAAVNHPHVITIHAVEQGHRVPYLVMEYIDGESLQRKLEREGPLELVEILRIGHQIASGLAAAHSQGLVHRDIKPANILLENGVQRVKITDFGLARAVGEAAVTRTGEVTGTPQYMSPEQAQGNRGDHRSDLFSLGCVLYAMCSGRSPFRADSALAALRRVCDDAPRPIREINPEIPDWLVEIVDKLLAKNPNERFQSADELAALLGRRLAEVQSPSAAEWKNTAGHRPSGPEAKTASSAPGVSPSRVRSGRRRPVIALALAAVLTAGLGLSEATGLSSLTDVVATVLRIQTPEGTLVVEVADPEVRVTIEGDGGLVITGAGPQEVRLQPGRYQLQAAKNGEPVHTELVTITRGDRQVVTVSLEGQLATATARGQAGAFVLLGGEAIQERGFNRLAAAVHNSSAGDTIEIRGDGPFVTDGVTIRHSLVIRAAEGYRPSIALSQPSADNNTPLIRTYAALVLEGLELRRIGGASGEFEGRWPDVVHASGRDTSLHVVNCRLVKLQAEEGSVIRIGGAPVWSIRNCELVAESGVAVACDLRSSCRGTIENCVSAIAGFRIGLVEPDASDVAFEIRRNTFVGSCTGLTLWSRPSLPEVDETAPPIRLVFSANATFCTPRSGDRATFFFHQYSLQPALSAGDAEALLPRLIDLHERHNVYLTGTPMLRLAADWKPLAGTRGKDLADWDSLWGQTDTGSIAGQIRFQGGDLIHRLVSAGEELTAEDFRLRPDSAGYQAGPDGEDLGADIDLVGPGAAYERWKQTPDYQEWLQETRELIRR